MVSGRPSGCLAAAGLGLPATQLVPGALQGLGELAVAVRCLEAQVAVGALGRVFVQRGPDAEQGRFG